MDETQVVDVEKKRENVVGLFSREKDGEFLNENTWQVHECSLYEKGCCNILKRMNGRYTVLWIKWESETKGLFFFSKKET